jgi:hypothetical protein
MAIDWPTTPTVGQIYPLIVTPGLPQWIWNGEGWQKVLNAGQVVSVFVSLLTNENAVIELPQDITGAWTLLTHI